MIISIILIIVVVVWIGFNDLNSVLVHMKLQQRNSIVKYVSHCLTSCVIYLALIFFQDEKWPEPPAFLFMIDASYNSVRSGLLDYICHILKTDLLDYLPKFVKHFSSSFMTLIYEIYTRLEKKMLKNQQYELDLPHSTRKFTFIILK